MKTQPLAALPLGRRGLITALRLPEEKRRRLLELGFVPGAEVCPLQRSPGGDPVAYLICGAVIALREEDAACIWVCPADSGEEGWL